MDLYYPGQQILFDTSYQTADGQMVDPANPVVVLFDPIDGITTLALQRVDVGEYTLAWTIPTDAMPGFYRYKYGGTVQLKGQATQVSDGPYYFQVVLLGTPPAQGPAPPDTVRLLPDALTTVPAVRDGFSTSASDDEVRRKINRISARFSQRCSRSWGWQTNGANNPEYLQAQGKWYLYTRRRPITAVAQIQLGAFTYSSGSPTFVGWQITDYQRTAQFDAEGKLYRIAGWVMVVPEWDRLTGDPDVRRSSQQFTVQLQYSAGYVLPQHDGVVDAAHNPSGLARNLPYHIEDACIREVRNLLSLPYGGRVEQRTAGGWSQRFEGRHGRGRATEFETETEEILSSECRPGALMR